MDELQTLEEANLQSLLEDILQEVYLGDLLPAMAGATRQGIHTQWDFFDSSSSDLEGKSLPYHDQGTLDQMHKVGYRLWRDTNVQTAISVLVTYVVYKGWWYSITRVKDEPDVYTDDKLQLLQRTHRYLLKSVGLGNKKGWFFLQKESYLRFLRDGEYYRRWWIMPDGTLQVRFIEVTDIRQPPSLRNVINVGSLPETVLRQIDPKVSDVAPGELGIVTMPGDAATEIGYWQRLDRQTELWQFLSADRVQHAKCNVDANDPRGVPAFYDAVCAAHQANEVTDSMNELAIKQSKYAVVHKHRATNRLEQIRALTRARTNELNTQVSEYDRDPSETHLKNVDIEMHAMQAQARQYVEVIQQDQRTIGGLRSVPEFIISNDANTGNRSSLLAATSPFGRRVQTDQKEMWHYDEELQWEGLAAVLNWKEATKNSAKRRVMITVTFPLSETKDPLKDTQAVIHKREDGIISRQQQRRELDIDHDQMENELQSEGGIKVSPNKIVRQTTQRNENGKAVPQSPQNSPNPSAKA